MGHALGTVLVVDDARSIRELLHAHLSRAGYRVLLAEDAVEAGNHVVHDAPDIIILDVQMPYMSGYEFLDALKSDPDTRHIPVVILSSSPDIAHPAKKLDAVAYLAKPVLADRLLEVVALYVSMRRQLLPDEL